MKRDSFGAVLRQTVVIPVIALATLAAVLLWGIQSLTGSMQWVDHTDQVIGASQQLLTLILDMETGLRGYLITGSGALLQPYNEAAPIIDSKFDTLNQLVSDNPAQQARLATMRSRFDQWQRIANPLIELRRSREVGGYEINLQRNQLMDAVRAENEAFIATEERLRSERVRTARNASRRVTLTCVLLSLAIGGFLAILTRRRMRTLRADFQKSLDIAEARAEELRTLANAIPQLAWMANPDGYIFWYNQRWYQYTGTTPHDMEGWGWQSVHDPEVLPKVLNEWQASIATGEPFEMVFPLRGADGVFRPFLTRVMPVKDAEGKVARWFGTNTDITERKRAEDALQQSLERLERVLEVETVGVMFWDLNTGCMIDANDTFLKLMGYSRSQVEARELNWQTLTPPEYMDVSRAEVEKFLVTGRVGPYEKEYFCKDGTRRWLLFAGSSLGNNQCVEFCVDIADRKHAEQQVRELNQQLEARVRRRTAELETTLLELSQTEKRFVTLANFVPQFVWMCTPDGLNVYFNQRWVDYTGLTLEESYGTGWNTPFHPDDKQVAWDAWNHATQTGEKYRVESRLRAADGSYRWFLMLGEPMNDAEGHAIRWFGTCTDIEDMKRSEAAQLESQRGLEAANKELEAFSYSVSHDLRGPLRTMDGFSQALLEDHSQRLDEKGLHYLGRIRTAAQKMGQLIDDLLQLSRLSRAEMQIRSVDMSEMAREVIDELQGREPDRNVDVHIEPGLEVRGDPGLLQVALYNLLSNAWKFTSRRERALIEIGRVKDLPNATFFVRDNGAGFDMQYANHLFSPFQRLHADEEFKGTGIGLATVQRIFRRHHGRIWAEAAEGKGATFYFELDSKSTRQP